MEKIHCDGCNQPTFHQTKNLYQDQIHQQGNKCLVCGEFSGEPSEVIKLPQKAIWRIDGDEAVRL